MVKFFLSLFILLINFNAHSLIVETKDLNEIKSYISNDSTVLFDMDDTLTDSPLHVGSGAWRQFIREKIAIYERENGAIIPGKNLHDHLTLFLARHGPIKPVDDNLPAFVEELQQQGILTLVFTARGPIKWYSSQFQDIDLMTHTQLHNAGFNFNNSITPVEFESLSKSEFSQGVFFSSGIKKGPFLQDIIEKTGFVPRSIVFIDDKLDQVQSLEKTMQKLNIPYVGIWYRQAETNHKNFNVIASTIQLEEMLNAKQTIPDVIAEKMADMIDLSADDYFYNFLKMSSFDNAI